MSKSHHITHKHDTKDLQELREKDLGQYLTKAELLEQNAMLSPKHADNENHIQTEAEPEEVSPEEAGPEEASPEEASVESETTPFLNLLDSSAMALANERYAALQDWQDLVGTLIATQRRMAEVWLENWCALCIPQLKSEEAEDSALDMG